MVAAALICCRHAYSFDLLQAHLIKASWQAPGGSKRVRLWLLPAGAHHLAPVTVLEGSATHWIVAVPVCRPAGGGKGKAAKQPQYC